MAIDTTAPVDVPAVVSQVHDALALLTLAAMRCPASAEAWNLWATCNRLEEEVELVAQFVLKQHARLETAEETR